MATLSGRAPVCAELSVAAPASSSDAESVNTLSNTPAIARTQGLVTIAVSQFSHYVWQIFVARQWHIDALL